MSDLRQLIIFSVEGQRLALHLEAVDRVERAVEVTPLPGCPDVVLGVVNLKGQIVPVFNLRKRFHLPEREVDLRDQFIFARAKRQTVALVVDAVHSVVETRKHDETLSSEILPALEGVEGVAKLDDGLVLIHDLDRFLSLQEENALAEALNPHD